jgi:hypothetical protein
VSTSSTSASRDVAAFTASKTTAAGSAPATWWMTSTSIRRPHSWSCSMAAARKVSAAAMSTRLPSALSLAAIFAVLVVLPAPLTPSIRMTEG